MSRIATTLSLGTLAALCVVSGFLLTHSVSELRAWVFPRDHTPAASTVRIKDADGLGSGVHVGDGIIITAAHVVDHVGEEVTVTDEQLVKHIGMVDWINKDYDLAAVRIKDAKNVPASPMACRAPVLREQVELVGNPVGFFFVHSFGRVGRVHNYDDKPVHGDETLHKTWASYVFLSAPIVPGMSGGPVFDSKGNIIAITVGVVAVPSTPFSSSMVGIGIAVPITAYCDLSHHN